MNKIRQSYDGIKSMVTNVIAFVAGNNDSDSSLSSAEVVECGSDCSQCCSENGSISMNEGQQSSSSQCSKRSSYVESQARALQRRSKDMNDGEAAVEELVNSLSQI